MRSADTFLPVARIRHALRIPTSVEDATLDANIMSARESAISWCESYANIPVIDRMEAVHIADVSGKGVRINRPYVGRLAAIRYWSVGATDATGPDASLSPLPRNYASDSGVTVVFPDGGFPAHATDAGVWFVVESGVAESHAVAGLLREAAIVATRHFYNGAREIRDKDAMNRLLVPIWDNVGGRDRTPNGAPWDDFVPTEDGTELTWGGNALEFAGVRMVY